MNLTPKFNQLIYQGGGNVNRNYFYFLIPGLYYKRWGDAYMKDNIALLNRLGVSYKLININSDTVENNASFIRGYIIDHIRRDKRKLVIIGHSKGAVDAGTAIAKYNLYNYVHAFISIQAPWFGTPIVDEQEYSIIKIFNTIASLMDNGDKEALRDMGYQRRYNLIYKYPFNTSKTKTISFVSTIQSGSSLFYLIPDSLMRSKSNSYTDGVLRPVDGIIPGSDYIQIDGMSHNESVLSFGNNSSINPYQLTHALLSLI